MRLTNTNMFVVICGYLCLGALATNTHAQEIDPLPNGNLIGGYSLTEGGPVSLASNRPVALRNLTINALPNHGNLIAGGSAAPFESLTTNTDTTWAVESASDVTIDGIVQLDLEVEPEAFLTGQAFDGTTTSEIIFNGITDGITDTSMGLVALYSEEGGNMLVATLDHPVELAGIEFVAEPGILTQGDSPAPFNFFVPNGSAPGNVTVGNLGTPAFIEGVVELDIFVAPNTKSDSISATWSIAALGTLPVTIAPSLERFAAPTISCIIPADELVGDLDDNGTVEFGDFLILSSNFGLDVNTYREGDINCNGTVDFEDFLRLGNRFGLSRTDAAQSVPEPAGGYLLIVGLVGVLSTRRKVSR